MWHCCVNAKSVNCVLALFLGDGTDWAGYAYFRGWVWVVTAATHHWWQCMWNWTINCGTTMSSAATCVMLAHLCSPFVHPIFTYFSFLFGLCGHLRHLGLIYSILASSFSLLLSESNPDPKYYLNHPLTTWLLMLCISCHYCCLHFTICSLSPPLSELSNFDWFCGWLWQDTKCTHTLYDFVLQTPDSRLQTLTHACCAVLPTLGILSTFTNFSFVMLSSPAYWNDKDLSHLNHCSPCWPLQLSQLLPRISSHPSQLPLSHVIPTTPSAESAPQTMQRQI
jgi:hypothetical protein